MVQRHKFWDRIAERYAKSPIADEAAYQKKLAVTRGYFRPDMEAVEFGCGTGSTAILHAPHVRHVRAIDLSGNMLQIARHRAAAAGVANIAFEQGDIEGFTAAEASVDAVLCLSLLHLLADREAAIRKVHRLLRPGGLFVSSTPCLADTPYRFIKFVAPLGEALGLLPQLRVFSVAALTASLTAAGFAIEHQWQPGPGKAVFLVARKAGGQGLAA